MRWNDTDSAAVKSVRWNNTDSADVKTAPSEKRRCETVPAARLSKLHSPKVGATARKAARSICADVCRAGDSDARYIIWDVHGLTFPFCCDIII